MSRPMRMSDEVIVDVTPQRLYELLSTPAEMARWSPENTGVTAAGPLVVGSTFRGSNERGPLRWITDCVVTAADPGERFAFG